MKAPKSSRRKPYKRKVPTAKVVPSAVKKYVKSTLHKNVENKYHLIYASNQSITSPFVQTLMATISLGNQHSQRIGNSVRVMSAKIDIVVNNAVYNSITNPNTGPIIYRWFIMSQIKDNSNSFSGGGFFELNNSSTIIQYNNLDQVLAVNKSQYRVHKQGRFTLGCTALSSGFPSANSQFDNNKFSICKTIYFNKYIAKKLLYDDGGTTPTNTNCWLVILPTYANGSGVSGYTPGNITYAIHYNYEDS